MICWKKIVCWVVCMLPVLAVLVLLAAANILYLLPGLVIVLASLIALKRVRPELFSFRGPAEQQTAFVPGETIPPEPEKKAYLVLAELDAFEGKRIKVDKLPYFIGRGEPNDFQFDDPRIGRRHLRIESKAEDDACYAVDLGSVNGTYLNSARMEAGEAYRLAQGDRLMINDHPFEVEYAHY